MALGEVRQNAWCFLSKTKNRNVFWMNVFLNVLFFLGGEPIGLNVFVGWFSDQIGKVLQW